MAYKPLHSLTLACLWKHLFEMTPSFTPYAVVQRLEIRRLRILKDNSLYVSWDSIHLVSKGKTVYCSKQYFQACSYSGQSWNIEIASLQSKV